MQRGKLITQLCKAMLSPEFFMTPGNILSFPNTQSIRLSNLQLKTVIPRIFLSKELLALFVGYFTNCKNVPKTAACTEVHGYVRWSASDWQMSTWDFI